MPLLPALPETVNAEPTGIAASEPAMPAVTVSVAPLAKVNPPVAAGDRAMSSGAVRVAPTGPSATNLRVTRSIVVPPPPTDWTVKVPSLTPPGVPERVIVVPGSMLANSAVVAVIRLGPPVPPGSASKISQLPLPAASAESENLSRWASRVSAYLTVAPS